MPTCMLQAVRCDRCSVVRPRKDMSIFNGICAQCFEQYYMLCGVCGCLLQVERTYEQNIFYRANDPYVTPLCYSCWLLTEETGYWPPLALDVSIATYQRIRSKRKYGVEVETHYCIDYENLRGQTKFGCKNDCSIAGKEFISPILYGDAGFAEIEKLLTYAEKKCWSANGDCGCHTHYDMRNESNEQLYRIAYAYAKTYDFWASCVSWDRCDSNYCHAPTYTIDDMYAHAACNRVFKDICYDFDRYDYVNINAYNRHTTFEVRLLEGTVDAETICNWITVHAQFIDYVKNLSFSELEYQLDNKRVFSTLVKIVDNTNVTDWLAKRIKEFST